MRENLRGVVVRLGIFLMVCLVAAFLLVSIFGQLRFGEGKSLLRRVHQRIQSEGGQPGPHRRG